MYSVVCDANECEADAQEDGDYRAWSEKDGALSDAEQNYWLELDGLHLCPEHWRECWYCTENVLDGPDEAPCPKCGAPYEEAMT